MPEYVALLRGITPTNPKMANAHLREIFEALGFDDVRTVIASGNVLFASSERSAKKLETQIEGALLYHLGSPCLTIIRSRRQIEQLTKSDAFAKYDDGPTERCNITFLDKPSSRSVDDKRAVHADAKHVFTVVDTTDGKASTELMRWIEKTYGKASTTRTWKSVHRIHNAFAC